MRDADDYADTRLFLFCHSGAASWQPPQILTQDKVEGDGADGSF